MGEEKKDPKGDPNVRPYDNAFMQLKLKAMMPRHSPQLVVACTILVAVIFIPLGVTVILASDQIWEQEIRYDNVKNCNYNNNDGILSLSVNGSNSSQGCQVRKSFKVDQTISRPIYMYYRIKGLHQNYRDYTDSVNHDQLAGYSVTDLGDLQKCWPFRRPIEFPGMEAAPPTVTLSDSSVLSLSNMRYNPCGAIAWSMFNDSFALYQNKGTATVTNTGTLPTSVSANVVCDGSRFGTDGVAATGAGSCVKKGIALQVDRNSRFQTAKTTAEDWTHSGSTGASNIYLANGYYNQELGHKVPLATDEDFMVWARPAAMPDFRKLYRRIDVDLTQGEYVLDIKEFYDTSSFKGEKYVVLATTSWVGGGNKILGILFLAFGALSFVLAIVFFLVALVKKPTVAE